MNSHPEPIEQDPQSGAVTAEFAVVLPAVIFILACLLGAAATGIVSLNLQEASRLGARALARGESPETVQRIVQEIDPDIRVQLSEDQGKATVLTSRQAPGILGSATGWELSAQASVPLEQAQRWQE